MLLVGFAQCKCNPGLHLNVQYFLIVKVLVQFKALLKLEDISIATVPSADESLYGITNIIIMR
jgi:hypothetical protein